MKRKPTPPKPAPKPPEFANNPLQAALAGRAAESKKAESKKATAKKAQLPPPPSMPSSMMPPTKMRPSLPDRPLSAQELFEFAINQLPPKLTPYDLKFGSGTESPKLPDIDDQADKKARSTTQPAASAHLTPAQREALREATRVRELQAAFEQEMRDTGVRRAAPSKLADLQTAAAAAASTAAIAGRPVPKSSDPAPLSEYFDDDTLAVPTNFTFVQKRLLERAQRKDDPIPALNLRGLTLAEAIPALQTFLDEQRNQGRRTVRVITGKGKQSEAEPVLKGAVEGYLLGAGAHLVSVFAPEITRDGDFGAYAVQLKKT